MLTPEQFLHNLKVDEEIRKSNQEYEEYIAECNKKREEFYYKNPNFPFKSMHIPVLAPRFVASIKYIDVNY